MKHLSYLPSQDVYIGTFGVYSEEEVAYSDRLEKAWRIAQSRRPSFYQLLETFPEARPAIKRKLVEEIRQCERDLQEARLLYNQYTYTIIPQRHEKDKWFSFVCRDVFVEELTKGREQKIKRNCFYLSALTPNASPHMHRGITPQDIGRAKDVPLDTFLTINRNGFAGCPFHEDKTPSLKVYRRQNRWYCFSCNSGTDIIDLVMKQDECDFITAVKKLLNK